MRIPSISQDYNALLKIYREVKDYGSSMSDLDKERIEKSVLASMEELLLGSLNTIQSQTGEK